MLDQLFYILAGTSAFLLTLGIILYALEKKPHILFVLGGLLMLLVGITIATDNIQTLTGQNEYCVEDSHYWNCSSIKYNCTGTPDINSCGAYTQTQCNELNTDGENCTWYTQNQECWGTPTWTCQQLHAWGQQNGYGNQKCTETYGCELTQELTTGLCDAIYNNCTTTPTYQNITTQSGANDRTLELLYYVLILGGLFFTSWGTLTALDRKEE